MKKLEEQEFIKLVENHFIELEKMRYDNDKYPPTILQHDIRALCKIFVEIFNNHIHGTTSGPTTKPMIEINNE